MLSLSSGCPYSQDFICIKNAIDKWHANCSLTEKHGHGWSTFSVRMDEMIILFSGAVLTPGVGRRFLGRMWEFYSSHKTKLDVTI